MQITTIRHAVESFRHFMEDRGGRPSSSMAYPPKLIYYFLNMYKNKVSYEDRYLTGKLDKDLNIELTIPCVELEKADMVECPCAPASGCVFFKSVHPLPRMNNGVPHSVTLIKKEIGQTDYGVFTFVDWYNFEDKIGSRVEAQRTQPYFTMKNINSSRHLYVYANSRDYPNLKAVAVSGQVMDPIEFAAFPICGEPTQLCDPLEVDFTVEDSILSKVFALTFNALMSFKNGSPISDILNNNNNDTVSR